MPNKESTTLKKLIANTAFLFIFLNSSAILYCSILNINNYNYFYLIALATFLVIYILNRYNFALIAKLLLFITILIEVFSLSIIYGENSGIEFYFVAILGMIFAHFSFDNEKFFVYFFSILTIVLWGILFINDFTLFGIKQINNEQVKLIYILVIASLIISIISQLYFFTSINLKYYLKVKKIRAKAFKDSEDKTNFLNTMSHEIRTPLNAINGLSYILKTENPEKHQEKHVNSLVFYGKKLMKLLNNVLDYSKYQSEKVALVNTPNNLVTAIKDAIIVYEKECEKKGLNFSLIIDKNLPIVSIDLEKFLNIIENLVVNAIRYTTNGGITLMVKEVNSKKDTITLQIVVKDSGLGISKAKQEIILSSNNDPLTLTKNKVGLGLPIVKNILELMNSKIELKSKFGLGTNFYFTLELEKVNAAVVKRNVTSKKLKLYGKKVLVVDDNKINLLIAKKCLEDEKLLVVEANNSLEAVEKMQKEYFDIVLMDIQMPILNGFEATKKIRTFNKDTPIYALSASVMSDLTEEIQFYGFNGLILKPFEPKALVKLLKDIIGYE
ncbi:MAG: response regulator [Polaribacter sp.]